MTQHDPISAATAYRQALEVIATISDLAAARRRAQQARALAHQILAAADAAESDAFVIGWLGADTARLDDRQRAALLTDFRAFRERLRGEHE